MTLLVLVILAVIWAAVLVPPYLQNRSESRPADSISTFRNQLSVLERRATMVQPRPGGPLTSPATAAARTAIRTPYLRADQKKRRRDILLTLAAAAGLTLLLGLVLPQVLVLNLLIDVLLVAYVALLVRHKRLAEERHTKVRYLSSARRPAPAPVVAPPAQLALRRSAGG